jgi:hypothetical protein
MALASYVKMGEKINLPRENRVKNSGKIIPAGISGSSAQCSLRPKRETVQS